VLDETLTVAEAPVSWKQLQSRRWQRLARGVYLPARDRADPMRDLAAMWRRLPEEAAFCGHTAGWLHGLDLPPCSPIEVAIPSDHKVAHRAGVRLRKVRLQPGDVVIRQGFRVTSALRTCADLGSSRDLTAAVIALDMALNSGLITAEELGRLTDRWAGRKGVVRLRRAAALADLAESPMETRLRLLLVRSGLPPPAPQVTLSDQNGHEFARADLYYASHRLCIEFDGGHHREALIEDNRRQNRMVDAGFTVLRFTSSDLLGAPERIVAIVRAALSRPAPAVFAPIRPIRPRRVGDLARNGGRGLQ
jgi:uncharacterized protein DUF559